MLIIVPSIENPVANKPPTKIPTKSELYTSFVISARMIATNGGTNDQIVAYIILFPFFYLIKKERLREKLVLGF